MPSTTPQTANDDEPPVNDDELPPLGVSVLSDEELVERAYRADNSDKFEALFTEAWPEPGLTTRYDSERGATLALFTHLRWWARHDLAQVVRLFEESRLHEGNGEEIRDDYGELLEAAGELLGSECYDPEHGGSDE